MQTFLHMGFAFSLLTLAGCAAAASTAAPTFVPPTETATRVPPTVTVPVETPTPIPTANFTRTDILGLWFRSDPERGALYLTISEDGSYKASHGTPDDVVHSGSYSLEGRIFTFVNGWNCSPLGETQGQYILRLAGGGAYLLFEPFEDACPDRPQAFKSFRWDRITATPTPVP